jgi:hypothetical protein
MDRNRSRGAQTRTSTSTVASAAWMRRSGERTFADGSWIVRANAPARPPERVMGYALAAIVPSPLAAYTVHASHCVASVRQSWAPGGTFVVSGF